jgi:hypothetical protein
MSQDKRLTSEQNTLAILTFLHRFGWLTSRMISALLWPEAKQAPALARRTLKALAEQKLVIKRPLAEGGDCYVLSATGARWLTEKEGITAKGGAALQLGNPVHRACANWYLIDQIRQGNQVWTEYEIQTGRAPVCNVSGKTPDGLIQSDFGLIWVEVENAWKNRSERGKVVTFCQRCLFTSDQMSELAPNFYLFRVAIVSTNLDALKAMHRSMMDALAVGDISDTQAGNIELVLLPVDKSLVATNQKQCLLYDLL